MSQWEKLSQETAYSGFRTIVKKTFRLPDGRVKVFDVKAEDEVACIMPVTERGTVLMVNLFSVGHERAVVQLPGGGTDGEAPEVAASRELLEETGYAPQRLVYLGPSISCPYSTRIKHNFLALECRKVEGAVIDADEQPELVEVPLEEFRRRLYANEFPESDTGFVGLARYDALAASASK